MVALADHSLKGTELDLADRVAGSFEEQSAVKGGSGEEKYAWMEAIKRCGGLGLGSRPCGPTEGRGRSISKKEALEWKDTAFPPSSSFIVPAEQCLEALIRSLSVGGHA